MCKLKTKCASHAAAAQKQATKDAISVRVIFRTFPERDLMYKV